MQQKEKEHRQNSIYSKRFCFTISILGVITVTAVSAGEATITVKCGTAEDVVIEATVEEAAPVAPEGGTECVPDGYGALHAFYAYDFTELAGTTVKISVSVCKRGGEDAKVALQFNDMASKTGLESGFTLVGDSWDRTITEDWTAFTYTFSVPQKWENSDQAIYFQIRENSNYNYDEYTFYYKDFSVEEVVVDLSKEFYIAEDVTFTDEEVVTLYGSDKAVAGEIYLNDGQFADKLPENLKSDATLVEAFNGLGWIEYVDYFEFSCTLTEATVKDGGESWDPQFSATFQGVTEGTWSSVDMVGQWNGIGEPTEGNPKSSTQKVNSSVFASWTSAELGKVGVEIVNAKLGTVASGSFSIKVVLK